MSTHPNTLLFARGTLARLALWPALRLAVHASWGGPASAEKQRWLAGVLVDQFEPFIVGPSTATAPTPTPPPDAIYVEDLLLQIMADEFDVMLEDDSAAAVARGIVALFEAVRAGDDTLVKQLEAQADSVKGTLPKCDMGAGSGSESESGSEWEDDDDDESVPQLLHHSPRQPRGEPSVDEDGFTIVKRRGHQ